MDHLAHLPCLPQLTMDSWFIRLAYSIRLFHARTLATKRAMYRHHLVCATEDFVGPVSSKSGNTSCSRPETSESVRGGTSSNGGRELGKLVLIPSVRVSPVHRRGDIGSGDATSGF